MSNVTSGTTTVANEVTTIPTEVPTAAETGSGAETTSHVTTQSGSIVETTNLQTTMNSTETTAAATSSVNTTIVAKATTMPNEATTAAKVTTMPNEATTAAKGTTYSVPVTSGVSPPINSTTSVAGQETTVTSAVNQSFTNATTESMIIDATSQAGTTSMHESTNQMQTSTTMTAMNFTSKPASMGMNTNNPLVSTTSTMSSPIVTSETTEPVAPTVASNLILNLEVWQFSLIVAAAGLLLLILILLMLFFCCRRRKKIQLAKKRKANDVWATGGNVAVQMVNMTDKDELWNTESIDDTVTTAHVVEPTTVNVFANEAMDFTNSPKIGHKIAANSVANSVKSSPSLRSNASDATSMFKKAKTAKTLTKVSVPVLANGLSPNDVQSVSDLDETENESESTNDDKSDATSVFSDSNLHTPSMGTFRSPESTSSRSPRHGSTAPSEGSRSPKSKPLVVEKGDLAPESNGDDSDITGANIPKQDGPRQESFLHTTSTPQAVPPSPAVPEQSNNLPPPPAPPEQSNNVPPPPPV